MGAVDPRIVSITIDVNGDARTYDTGLWIKTTGNKFANALQNEAQVEVANLTKADRDWILTATSPFNMDHQPKTMTISAGRQSYGASVIFVGNITTCEPTQPPDIILKFKCKTGQFNKGKIVSNSQTSSVPLSQISQQVASDNGLTLNFQATDKQISNYSFTGAALKQVDHVGDAGNVNAYVDDSQMIVLDADKALTGETRVLSAQSGMVGIPQLTEHGIKITYMLDNQSKLGGSLQVQSTIYAALSGTYKIYKLGWDISSRDNNFYWIAECKRLDASGNVVIPSGVPTKKGKK